MRYMLDTNTCIHIIRKNPEKVLKHFMMHKIGDIGISSMTLAELMFGVAKSHYPEKNRRALERFISPMDVAAFDESSAERYGTLRAELERSGRPIGSMDMLIAAHALSLGVTLVTNNVREFARVSSLKIEDWTQ